MPAFVKTTADKGECLSDGIPGNRYEGGLLNRRTEFFIENNILIQLIIPERWVSG
jgi:hypothetical protein